MSQFSPRRISPDRATPPCATWPLFAVPALGAALAACSAFAVFTVAGFAGVLVLGDGAGPGEPAYDYVNAHFADGVFGFLTGYPLVLAACCALVMAATGFAAARRRTPAVLLLAAAAAMPCIPGLAFLFHLLSLPPG